MNTTPINYNATMVEVTQLYTNTTECPTPNDLYNKHIPIITILPKYLKVVMYIFGFPGNIMACILWLQRPLLHSSGCYLAALAISDLLVLTLSVIYDLENIWNQRTLRFPVICQLFPVLFMAVQYMSPLLTLAFTVERFISCRFPLQRRLYCTVKRATIIILIIAVFVLMAGGIQSYIWNYYYEQKLCTPRPELDDLRAKWAWATEAFMFMLVPLLILVVNVLLMFTIRKSKRLARQLYGIIPKHKTATTDMLLVVSFYLIFTTLPVTVVYAMYDVFIPSGDACFRDNEENLEWKNHFRYMIVREIVYDIGMSHYVCNFYLYLATGRRFRIETKRCFQRWFYSSKNPVYSQSWSSHSTSVG